MEKNRSYTLYRGYRIYLPEHDEYQRDKAELYLVHVLMESEDTRVLEHIPLPGVVAETAQKAADLSIREGMRLVDARHGDVTGRSIGTRRSDT